MGEQQNCHLEDNIGQYLYDLVVGKALRYKKYKLKMKSRISLATIKLKTSVHQVKPERNNFLKSH